ncbi:hypothetical protein ACT7DO_29220 [Bacillus pacificus]
MDDDDDNNNVNKYKFTGGKCNEAFTHKKNVQSKAEKLYYFKDG